MSLPGVFPSALSLLIWLLRRKTGVGSNALMESVLARNRDVITRDLHVAAHWWAAVGGGGEGKGYLSHFPLQSLTSAYKFSTLNTVLYC
jgi:hypothetical protein